MMPFNMITLAVLEEQKKTSASHQREKLNSCCKVIQERIGLKDTAEQMMTKLEKGDFSFAIDDSDFIPEKLLTLKPKTHKSGLILLIEKNIFISWESKELAEEAVNNMEIGNRQKSCVNKKCKIEKQMLIETAFAKAMDNNTNNSSHSSDDEDETL